MADCHLIARTGSFLFRFNDTAFGSKWCGYWRGGEKLVEYWAFSFGGRWLSPGTLDSFHYSPEEPRARMSFASGAFSEEACFASRGLKVSAASKLPGRAELELAFNLRGSGENATGAPGRVASFEKGVLTIEGRSRRARVSGLAEFSLIGADCKKHYPGKLAEAKGWRYFNECEQDCLVVRLASRRAVKTAGFLIEDDVGEAPGRSKAKDPFLASAENRMSAFLAGGSFQAGHPYFAKFWVRDACICAPGLLAAGYDIRPLLENIAASQRADGAVPNFSGADVAAASISGQMDFSAADTTPLFILAVTDCWKESGHKEFLKDSVLRACSFFKRTDVDGDGLSETDSGSAYPQGHWTTWMDSIERSGKAVEVNFLWGAALKRAGMALANEELQEAGERLLKLCEDRYWKSEWAYFADTIGGPTYNLKSANILFPLALGEPIQEDRALAALKTIESPEFTKPWGVQTASTSNFNFDPSGYHTGCVWNLLTALAALAEVRYGRRAQAEKYLGILKANLGRRCEDSLDECFDGSGAPQGAVNQAWSICLVPLIFRHLGKK